MSADRIGSALQSMAADLATERRRVVVLKRENRELRMQLEALQRSVNEQQGHVEPSPQGR